MTEESKDEIESMNEGAFARLMSLDNPINPDGGMIRDRFVRDTALFLLGAGLDAKEVELFEKHGLGINEIFNLDISDLDYIGITCPQKKKNIMESIERFRKEQNVPQELDNGDEFHPDDIHAMTNAVKHLQTLSQSLPYLRRRMLALRGDCFFTRGASGPYTLDFLLELCLQQAAETQQQLLAFAQDFDSVYSEGAVARPRKRVNRKKWLLFVMLTVSSASLIVWGMRRMQDIQVSWSWKWPFLLPQ